MTKKGSVRESKTRLEVVLRKTFTDLVKDLATVDGKASVKLEKLVKNIAKGKLSEELKNEESTLLKAIPKEILDNDQAGRKYLEIFALCQPKLKPSILPYKVEPSSICVKDECTSSTNINEDKCVKEETTSSSEENAMKTCLESLFSKSDKPNELLSLAENACKDLNLMGKSGENFDISEMANMMTTFVPYIQGKVESGEIDVKKITEQAFSICNDMKESPELSSMIANNPQFATLATLLENPESMSSETVSPFSMLSGLTGLTGVLSGGGIGMESLSDLMSGLSNQN